MYKSLRLGEHHIQSLLASTQGRTTLLLFTMGSDNTTYENVIAEFTARTQTPQNEMRQCIVEGEWNGEVMECDKCGMRNPTIGLYICDNCDSTYCLICTPKTRYFYVGNTPLTFCTKSCRLDCLHSDYGGSKVCIRCHELKTQSEMQRIDADIGEVCTDCLRC
jgi:hypothetical protein